MAERNGDTYFATRTQRRVRWLYEELGNVHDTVLGADPTEAADRNRRSELLRPMGGFSGVRFQARTAEKCLEKGDLDGARHAASELLENSTRHGPPKYVVTARRILVEAALAAGDLAAAEAELTAALQTLRTNPAPLVAWRVYATLGSAYQQRDDRPSAHAAFNESARIIQEIASNIFDEQLRSRFLTLPAVEKVLIEAQS